MSAKKAAAKIKPTASAPPLNPGPGAADPPAQPSMPGNNAEITRAQQALRQSEEKFHSLFESSPDAIIVSTRAGLIHAINLQAERLFGYRRAELLGQVIEQLIPARFLHSHTEQRQSYHQDPHLRPMGEGRELFAKHKDGHEFPVDISLSPISMAEGLMVISTIRDISTRKQLEQHLRQHREQLETLVAERTQALQTTMRSLLISQEALAQSEAKATLSTLVASVTHELNTPISNCALTASTLQALSQEFQAVVARGQLKRSELSAFIAAIDSASGLLQRGLLRAQALLQSFKQVAADQASEQRRRFDLADTLKEVLASIAPSLKKFPQRVSLDIPTGIQMDSFPGALGQVVINLVNNAYLHGFENRSEGAVSIGAEVLGGQVKLRIADNGVGMSKEHLGKLFEPYFSTKIGKGGTGLGMAIVRNLTTKALGGTIEVQSTPGSGTRFAICLPLVVPDKSTS